MITKDSHVWWFVMGGALIMGMSSRLDLIDPLLPARHTQTVHALIELLAYLVGVMAGVARMPPSFIPMSDSGRIAAIQQNSAQADTAQQAATVAAVMAEVAVKATTEAATAAQVASDASVKAAEVP